MRSAAADWPRLVPLGDAALQIQLAADGSTPDVAVNAEALALADRLQASVLPLLDVVPAYASVTLHLAPGAMLSDLLAQLPVLLAGPSVVPMHAGRLVEVPVRYGGADGPELAALAASLGLAVPELVARHVAPIYQVAMLGFRPGFPYLLGLDPTLAAPRLATPRTRVPAGSVGIAGRQTGIYPDVAPGGWQLIGRTALRLFDPTRTEPALLAPGDRLRFVVEAIAT